jgi:hypothetical protein
VNEATKCSCHESMDRFSFSKAGNIKPNSHDNANIQYVFDVILETAMLHQDPERQGAQSN